MPTKYDILSPDGISLHPINTYKSKEKAFTKYYEWKRRFEQFGYYSSAAYGRIQLDELEKYCALVTMENGETLLTGTKQRLSEALIRSTRKVIASEMARECVGDGKRPNKFFVTIGYGIYKPHDMEEMIKVTYAVEPVTMLVDSEEQAMEIFNSIRLNPSDKIKSTTLSEVLIEDRITGVVKQKFLSQKPNGKFFIDII